MKHVWIINGIVCFALPFAFYEWFGYETGMIYVLCVIAGCLNRIGDFIRYKKYD